MTHQNDVLLHYAYCPCGVVGPLRARPEDAQADETAHDEVCSMRRLVEQLEAAPA